MSITSLPVGVPRYELRVPVMGSEAHLVSVHGEPGLLDEAHDRLLDLHHRWSRFEPNSEVSRINAAAGQQVEVSAETVLLVGLAVAGWEGTNGLFDPAVLPALVAAGYDRDFAALSVAADSALPVVPTPSPGCAGVEIDVARSLVRVPAGVSLDFGGVAKGLAADMVVTDLLDGGVAGACVNIGGDLRAEGVSPHRGGWLVGVEPPPGVGTLGTLRIRGGAVATTSRRRRTWGGSPRLHHLIDPKSGLPADTGLQAVTVVAEEGWQAEVLAKAAFLAGPTGGPTLLDDAMAQGLFVLDDGTVRTTPGWRELAL